MALEIPIYRFKSHVSFEKAKEASFRLNRFLETAPGFLSRRTIYDREQDVWIDFVEWESMSHALQAARDFEASTFFAEFAELADPAFNQMYHGEVMQRFEHATTAKNVRNDHA